VALRKTQRACRDPPAAGFDASLRLVECGLLVVRVDRAVLIGTEQASPALLDFAVRSMIEQPDGTEHDVTELLRAWSDGDCDAFERVMPLVYNELHRMAARYVRGERTNISLQATGLVNELCLRLLGWDAVQWKNRRHFFGVSAQMMRRVLVDIARRRDTERRGGAGAVRVPLESIDVPAVEPGADLLAVDAALQKLAAEDPRKAQVVELRFFGGLSVDETAEALGVSPRTVHTDWAFARAWLYRTLTATDVF
jgi:RNA polymerase sigma-70 factor, ECF subfamily